MRRKTGLIEGVRSPAEVLVWSSPVRADPVFAFLEYAPLDRLLQPGGLVFFQRLQVVQPTEKEEIGDLLDDLQGVGNAAGPEAVPDRIDLALDFTGDHVQGNLGDSITSRKRLVTSGRVPGAAIDCLQFTLTQPALPAAS